MNDNILKEQAKEGHEVIEKKEKVKEREKVKGKYADKRTEKTTEDRIQKIKPCP